jgi:hypothetical protein
MMNSVNARIVLERAGFTVVDRPVEILVLWGERNAIGTLHKNRHGSVDRREVQQFVDNAEGYRNHFHAARFQRQIDRADRELWNIVPESTPLLDAGLGEPYDPNHKMWLP